VDSASEGRPSARRSYLRIAEVLRNRVRSGTYPAGTMLPAETALSGEFGVVRNTLRRALAELVRERLIETVPGRGRVVRTEIPALPRYGEIAAELTAEVAAGRLRPGDVVPSEAELADRLCASRGTVRRALAELEAAGLVVTRQGRRRRVRPFQP
jgi:DNA-binding GntR family transcriptional regulator